MKSWRPIFVLSLGMMLITHCGGVSQGGSEAGNPTTTRSILGSVETASSNLVRALGAASAVCLVDTVIATDSSAQTTLATIDEDCVFSLALTVDKAYMLSFLSGDSFVAVLIANDVSSALIASSVFIVSAGDDDIDLGLVMFSGGEAFPTRRPGAQNDQDGDGFFDDDDDDDDDDGQPDSDEEDCDLDGFRDDYDDDSECDADPSDEGDNDSGEDAVLGEVLEVHPRNNEDHVGAEEEIVVRFNCEINEDTVNDETFAAANSSGDVIACDFTFHENGEEVECEHEDDFINGETYTTMIEGILCEDGTPISPVTWSWDTEASTED